MSHTDIVRDFLAAWDRRDVEAIMALIDTDCVYENVGLSTATGREAIGEAITGFVQSCRRIEWKVRHIAEAADGAVLTERIDVFETAGPTLTVPVMGVFELRQGRIVAWRDYFDVPGFQKQMAGG